MTEAQSTRRKDRPGIPKVAGLSGGAFAGKEFADAGDVSLAPNPGYPTKVVDGTEWATIETLDELHEALADERTFFEEITARIDADSPDYGAKLHAATNEHVEHFATILARVDDTALAERRFTVKDVNTTFIKQFGPVMGARVADFNKLWRPLQEEDGVWIIKRGLNYDDLRDEYANEDDAAAAAEKMNRTAARRDRYSRLTREEARWDNEFEDHNLEAIDAFADEYQHDPLNVTSANPWFGMVRFENLGSDHDTVVIRSDRLPKHASDVISGDSSMLMRIDPDILASGGTRDSIAARIAETEGDFGTLIGAARKENGDIHVQRFTGKNGTEYLRYKMR